MNGDGLLVYYERHSEDILKRYFKANDIPLDKLDDIEFINKLEEEEQFWNYVLGDFYGE